MGWLDRGGRWFRSRCRSAWKKRWGTFSSYSSTSRGIYRWIPSRRCARPTGSSSAVFNGWRNGCRSPGARRIKPPWMNSSPCGNAPRLRKSRRSPRERPTAKQCVARLAGPAPHLCSGRKTMPVELRRCHGIEDFRACVTLQKEVWNFTDAELVPLRMFVVADKVGGQVMGAFEGNTLVGFALSVPGTRSGHIYLHSHMLAVRKDHRNSGLGRQLKMMQREEALARGIELIEWTFDPLEIKNAYLNIEKLGAIVRRYNINQYGITSSPLQGGLPSDRLIAEWWLRSKRVEALLSTGKNPSIVSESSIEVPAQIYEWKAALETRSKAQHVQEQNREQFLRAFSHGQAVLGYERNSQGDGKFLLGHWDEKWSYASE